MEKGYNKKMIQKQILRAGEHSRNDLLEREKQQISEQKLMFIIIYYPAIQSVRNIMEELHILLTPNKELKQKEPLRKLLKFRMVP